MSLDNKSSGEKLFAFEINAIFKALRNLASNIITINNNRHWEYISSDSKSISGSGTYASCQHAVPSDANFAILDLGYGSNTGFPYQNRTQIVVARNGATGGGERNYSLYSGSNYLEVSVSWSGSTITVGVSYNSTIYWGGSSTVKFYT